MSDSKTSESSASESTEKQITIADKISDLVLYTDPARSGLAFLCGVLFVFLVQFGGYSVTTLLAYLLLLQVLACSIYVNVTKVYLKYVKNQTTPKTAETVEPLIAREVVDSYLSSVVNSVNALAAFAYKVLRSQDNILTIKVAVALFVLSILGRVFTGLTLFGMGWLLLFTVPKLYQMNKATVDKQLAKVNEMLAGKKGKAE